MRRLSLILLAVALAGAHGPDELRPPHRRQRIRQHHQDNEPGRNATVLVQIVTGNVTDKPDTADIVTVNETEYKVPEVNKFNASEVDPPFTNRTPIMWNMSEEELSREQKEDKVIWGIVEEKTNKTVENKTDSIDQKYPVKVNITEGNLDDRGAFTAGCPDGKVRVLNGMCVTEE